MKKIVASIILAATLALPFLTSCRSASNNNDGRLNILASTTFLADITRNVAGDRVEVSSLVPVGADPHAYQPAPSDVARISASVALVVNGLDYERFIEPLLKNAGGQRLTIVASSGLNPKMEAGGEHGVDPHMWLDPNLVVAYVENIRDGLIEADPGGEKTYRSNADAYISQLTDLDAWIVKQVNDIPVERRLLVTNHEALGYFAERYGFKVVGTVIPSLSSEAGTSARDMAALIDQIKATGARAIFLGDVENPKLANQIAQETGAIVVRDLYLESLTDSAPAATYIDMMKHNVTRIVNALK